MIGIVCMYLSVCVYMCVCVRVCYRAVLFGISMSMLIVGTTLIGFLPDGR